MIHDIDIFPTKTKIDLSWNMLIILDFWLNITTQWTFDVFRLFRIPLSTRDIHSIQTNQSLAFFYPEMICKKCFVFPSQWSFLKDQFKFRDYNESLPRNLICWDFWFFFQVEWNFSINPALSSDFMRCTVHFIGSL